MAWSQKRNVYSENKADSRWWSACWKLSGSVPLWTGVAANHLKDGPP